MDRKNPEPLLPVFLLGIINPIMLKTLHRYVMYNNNYYYVPAAVVVVFVYLKKNLFNSH